MFNFTKEEYQQKLQESGSSLLFKKISSDVVTPVLALLKVSQQFSSHHFLFESAENGNNKGRFSVLGFMPDQLWKSRGKKSFINNDFENNPNSFDEQGGDVLQNFRKLVNGAAINWDDLNYNSSALPSVCSGVFGYMGYDMVRLMEDIPDAGLKDDLQIPDSIFMRPQIIIVFDNLFDCALICAPSFDKNKNFDELSDKILEVEKILNSSVLLEDRNLNAEFNFTSNCTKEEYCAMVEKSKKYIFILN